VGRNNSFLAKNARNSLFRNPVEINPTGLIEVCDAKKYTLNKFHTINLPGYLFKYKRRGYFFVQNNNKFLLV